MKRLTYMAVWGAALGVSLMAVACHIDVDHPKNNPITYGESYMETYLATDKAAYSPGEEVHFVLNKMPEASTTVRYKQGNRVIKEEPLTGTEWTWTPPEDDFTGYLVDLYTTEGDVQSVLGSIGVDVSSDPKVFPRNGFLSEYGKKSQSEINQVMDNLCRHHITYVQFQDWHYKHHMPLAGTPAAPMDVWTDIISRDCYRSTVDGYIRAGHERNMRSLFYNLAYGALNDAAADGVSEDWYTWKDADRITKDAHELGSPFKSWIYIMNIKEQGWIDYIGQRTSDVYRVFDFDGYQVDQLGARGGIYDAQGNYDDQQQAGFTHFLQEMKRLEPGKRLVMNAVGGFGNDRIAEAGVVDFYYTEVWDKGDFATISNSIRDYAALPNSRFGGGENPAVDGRERQVVLAAYMNYDHGKMGKGEFNTPGVLMANAAIHAWGGAHLELGEHMLNNEYFPNSNLRMRGELEIATIIYYDFITAYQSFLRGGGNFTGVTATTADERLAFNQWPPVQGQVATVGRLLPDGKTAVAHLLNYTDATTLDWCDSNADQAEQQRVDDVSVTLDIDGAPATAVKAVWCATPDADYGVARALGFTQDGGRVTFTLPSLKYWTMVVVEYE